MTPRELECRELVELLTEYLEGALPPDNVTGLSRIAPGMPALAWPVHDPGQASVFYRSLWLHYGAMASLTAKVAKLSLSVLVSHKLSVRHCCNAWLRQISPHPKR